MSSFHGLEMAKQSLFTQQSALYTTGHNLSNANTKGYSRQRVNFETMSPYPSASRNRPEIPGQMGTGVKAGSIERVRDKFLDMQYRSENSQSSYWEAKSASLDRLERLMNEPTESGISHTMKQLWESLQDLAANPENSGAKSVVAERAQALADTFNYTSNSLESIRDDLNEEIKNNVKTANSLLDSIHKLNEQIKQIEPHGYLPNDLYDKRDQLVDELSGIVNITVVKEKSYETAPDIADGIVTISLVGDSKDSAVPLLDENGVHEMEVGFGGEQNAVNQLSVGGKDVLQERNINGSLKGLIESYGYMKDDQVEGSFPKLHQELNTLVKAIGEEFNKVHSDPPFFTGFDEEPAAGNITVSDAIIENPSEAIKASDSGYGDIASELADIFAKKGTIEETSINKFFEGMIGRFGVEAQKANTMKDNTAVLTDQVEKQRMSVSAVSLDEEMTNMIKFQHAYNAAARNMTAVDEMLDRIINNMGLVGR
ncbi:Flagellar hook-associated protein [Lentibacillus sp. JNUCC-1]|uniref:flagellar hook-associated protein FlgK n=1 Tax=Lentibacillus sp. JNUCC-1 TaxID=2654513 RepID=UPI0012E73B15|nr:flagellar hook-associated protein FlgK [Lentibacillus sp. JNUCC-1]MUV39056.1 Flagellar hook-associated protein [Lentibacillus sp. JNUCC-1]